MAPKKYTVAETGPRIDEFLNHVFKLAGFQLSFTVAEGETTLMRIDVATGQATPVKAGPGVKVSPFVLHSRDYLLTERR